MESDTIRIYAAADTGKISIHALRMESDMLAYFKDNSINSFLSTLSAWRATATLAILQRSNLFLSTLSAWRATFI